MSDEREERNRVLGMPVGPPRGSGQRAKQGEEPQHVMGLPADWFENVDLSPLRSLAHPARAYRRWARRRRLGPYADEDDS